MEVRDTLGRLLPKTIAFHLEAYHLDDAHAQITLLISPRHKRHSAARGAMPRPGMFTVATPGRSPIFHGVAMPSPGSFASVNSSSPIRSAHSPSSPSACPALWRPGRGGARLSQSLGLPVSRNTLLRVIRRAPCPVMTAPQVFSVDDFVLRKRHT